MITTASWVSDLAFDITSDNNHAARLDTTVEGGSLNSGMSPKQMLLGSLCACSGMDVVSLLNKMRVPFTKLIITAAAEQTDEHPKVFKSIEVVYKADVAAEQLAQLEKAVALSQDKYCGVSIMLKKHCEVSYTISLLP
ncbi:MAG TPA: osmotically inducible protein OsmC [Chitinophagaceae bacterium]|nr:osmotically inducible protein OsmC [Chitinophagaceae bacterium]HAN38432.1 osmotically inducible protein OsmC [Chitinophagaceae bacterium]